MEIDVSKCKYHVEEHEWWDIAGDKIITKNCCDIYLNNRFNRFNYREKCADNQNCFYRQIQQLEAENKELKDKLTQAYDDNDEYLEQIKESEQEKCDLLKENEKMYKLGCENYVAIEQSKRLYKLNKCLEEIEGHVKHVQEYVNRNIEDDVYSDMDIIIQKIKEVKNDR